MPKWIQGGWYTRTSLAGPAPPIHAGMTAGYDFYGTACSYCPCFSEKKSAKIQKYAISTSRVKSNEYCPPRCCKYRRPPRGER